MRLPVTLSLLILLLGGCAVSPAPIEVPEGADASDEACVDLYQRMDAVVVEARVRDGGGAPVPGYPWLRSSRFIQAIAADLEPADYLAALLEHDRRARWLELSNLPGPVADSLVKQLPEDDAGSAVVRCGEQLTARLLETDSTLKTIRRAAVVPDEYVTWRRWAGVYPISRFFILGGVAIWQHGTRNEFVARAPATPAGVRFEPAWEGVLVNRPELADLVRDAPRDSLGRLQLTDTERDTLLAAHAPVIELDKDAGYNRIGEPLWQAPGLPTVNVARPLVYTAVTHTRFAGETVAQLNYVFWFSSRPKLSVLDLLGGRLDGMHLRITLHNSGEPMLLESMHNCGCYHQYYPLSGLQARDSPGYAEPPLVLPSPGPLEADERLVVRMLDRSHYVRRVYRMPAVPGRGIRYVMTDYDELRSLPVGDGRRSLFDEDGLVTGSERDERMLFWVSGVPNSGAMRQMGRHVTAFVGRRHFDAPDLLDRVFRPVPEVMLLPEYPWEIMPYPWEWMPWSPPPWSSPDMNMR